MYYHVAACLLRCFGLALAAELFAYSALFPASGLL